MPNNQQKTSNGESHRIIVRFGNEILQAGHTAIPNLVLDHYAQLGITPAEMMFTIHIWQYWWSKNNPHPSLKSIATKMNVSWRQVHRYAMSLKEKGYLRISQRLLPGRGQATSEYDFSPLINVVVSLAQKSTPHTPLSEMSEGGLSEMSEAPCHQCQTKNTKNKNTKNKNISPPHHQLRTVPAMMLLFSLRS